MEGVCCYAILLSIYCFGTLEATPHGVGTGWGGWGIEGVHAPPSTIFSTINVNKYPYVFFYLSGIIFIITI